MNPGTYSPTDLSQSQYCYSMTEWSESTGMFDYSKVDLAIDRIVRATDPRIVIVFGSVARRDARDDSDLDVLVVFDRIEDETEAYVRVARQFIGLGIPFDIVVMEYDRYLRFKDDEYSFTHEIVTTGMVVYDREVDSEVSSNEIADSPTPPGIDAEEM